MCNRKIPVTQAFLFALVPVKVRKVYLIKQIDFNKLAAKPDGLLMGVKGNINGIALNIPANVLRNGCTIAWNENGSAHRYIIRIYGNNSPAEESAGGGVLSHAWILGTVGIGFHGYDSGIGEIYFAAIIGRSH